jgi:NAD(P)H-nitrite reductase large subunit
VLAVNLFSVGVVTPQDGSYLSVSVETERECYTFLFRDNLLVGAIFVGNSHLEAAAMKAVKHRRDCSEILHKQPSTDDVIDFPA